MEHCTLMGSLADFSSLIAVIILPSFKRKEKDCVPSYFI